MRQYVAKPLVDANDFHNLLAGVLWVCSMATAAFAQSGVALSLEKTSVTNGTLSWRGSPKNGILTIMRSTNLTFPIWLPHQNVHTVTATGMVAVPLTNNPIFYRSVGADASGNPPGMKLVPAGYFQMGDNYGEGDLSELPVHAVSVQAFYINQFEVTNQKVRDVFQWAYDQGFLFTTDLRVIKGNAGIKPPLLDLHRDDYPLNSVRYWSGITLTNGVFGLVPGRENQPCIDISWFGAAAYCTFLSLLEGLQPCFELTNYTCDFTKNGYRLPTEAEWEKAARGGLTGHHYPWESYGGGNFRSYISTTLANYTPPTLPHPFNMKPVGYYNGSQIPAGPDMANGYGLYDMAGNAREYCYDWFADDWYSQPGATLPDPTGPTSGVYRCTRGGSFDLGEKGLRVAARNYQPPAPPTAGTWYNGFRCVRRP